MNWKYKGFSRLSGVPLIIFVPDAATAAKSLQSRPTLCDPRDSSPPGSPSLGFSRQEHWDITKWSHCQHWHNLSSQGAVSWDTRPTKVADVWHQQYIYLRSGSVFKNLTCRWIRPRIQYLYNVKKKKRFFWGRGEKKNSAFNVQYPLHLLLSWKHC